MAPTEMSKLPLMMRMVAPAATSPSTDVCSRMLNRLRGLKKRSLTRPVIRPSTSVSASSRTHWLAAMNMRACCAVSVPLPCPFAPAASGAAYAVRLPTPRNSFIRLSSVASRRVDRGHDPSRSHDRDAIADREQLGQVRRHDDDGSASLEEIRDEAVDVVLGAHVHALRGFIEDVHLRIDGQPATDDDLLLVAAGESLDLLIDGGRDDTKALVRAPGPDLLRPGRPDRGARSRRPRGSLAR